MTDIATLLQHAAGSVDAAAGADLAPADLARGRRAAARLRTRRLAVRGTGVVAVAALAVVVGVGTGRRGASPASAATLVSYTGAQPAGYIVDTVPAGWAVFSSDSAFLILSSPSSPTTTRQIDDRTFTTVDGNIVVYWSSDPGPVAGSVPMRVGPHRGSFGSSYDEDGITTLRYDDDAGHFIDIQLPPALNWSATQAAAFAAGIHVTTAAEEHQLRPR